MEIIQLHGQYLCIIIAIAGFCILAIQLYAIVFYRKERDVITQYHGFLNDNPDVDLEDALVKRQISNDSPLRKRIQMIKDAVRHKRPASVSEFSALSDENDHSLLFNTIPTTFIGLFLIFGLGGTLYLLNILLADSDLKSIVQASGNLDTIKLREAVGKLYGGFGHAFVASLAGIGVTCCLVFVRGVFVNPLRGLFYHDLDSLTVTELLPRLQPREVALPDALVLTSRALEQVGEKMLAMVEIVQVASDNNRVTTELAHKAVAELGSFSDGMKAAADALDRSVTRLDFTFGDDGDWAKRSIALVDGMGDLAAKVKHHSAETDSLTGVTEKLHELLGDSVEKIAPLLPDLHEYLESHRERILTVADRLAEIDANLYAVDKRLEASIGSKITHLASAVISLQEIVSPLSREQLLPLGATVQNLNVQMNVLNGTLQDGIPKINSRIENTEKQICDVFVVLKAIEAMILPLKGAAEAVVSPLMAGAKAIENIVEIAPESVMSTRELTKINATLISGQQSLSSMINPLVMSLSVLKQDMDKINRRLTSVETAGTSIVESITTVETVIQTLASATNQWKTEVAQLSDKIGEQTQETQFLRTALESQNSDRAKNSHEVKTGFFHNWLGKQ